MCSHVKDVDIVIPLFCQVALRSPRQPGCEHEAVEDNLDSDPELMADGRYP